MEINKEKVIEIVKRYTQESVWHTFKNVYFDGHDGDKVFYFRTLNTIEQDYVIKAEVKNDSVNIYLAKEDFYEKYNFDFYDFQYETNIKS